MQLRARFEVVARESNNERLVIQDLDNGGVSVTNDAEAVIGFLVASGHLGAHQRLFYYDTEGDLDELRHDGRKFLGFGLGER